MIHEAEDDKASMHSRVAAGHVGRGLGGGGHSALSFGGGVLGKPNTPPVSALTRHHDADGDAADDDGGCVDTPDGWVSSTMVNCQEYKERKWCTPSGEYGIGWKSGYGTFATWAVGGTDASQACCVCGGGARGDSTDDSASWAELKNQNIPGADLRGCTVDEDITHDDVKQRSCQKECEDDQACVAVVFHPWGTMLKSKADHIVKRQGFLTMIIEREIGKAEDPVEEPDSESGSESEGDPSEETGSGGSEASSGGSSKPESAAAQPPVKTPTKLRAKPTAKPKTTPKAGAKSAKRGSSWAKTLAAKARSVASKMPMRKAVGMHIVAGHVGLGGHRAMGVGGGALGEGVFNNGARGGVMQEGGLAVGLGSMSPGSGSYQGAASATVGSGIPVVLNDGLLVEQPEAPSSMLSAR